MIPPMRFVVTALVVTGLATAAQAGLPDTTRSDAGAPPGVRADLAQSRWWVGTEVGYVHWGRGAAGVANSPRAGFSLRREWGDGPLRGASAGLGLHVHEARQTLLNTHLVLGYHPELFGRRCIGLTAGVGPGIRLGAGARERERFRAFAYEYGLRFRMPGGHRGRTRLTATVGWTTQRERLSIEDGDEVDDTWWGWSNVSYRAVTSGLRVGLGLAW